MREIKISESSLKSNNIIYVYTALNELVTQMNARADVLNDKLRCEYKVLVPDEYKDLFLIEAQDKISDVVAVNYKYAFFKKNVKTSGLNQIEKELLLTALIAADIEEDKKYIVKKLRVFDEYSIDGIFNFRMKPLKDKWGEIAGYIPSGFTINQLKDFVSYLIKDKCGQKVYVEGENVYDKSFNLLKRRELLLSSQKSCEVLKEILLSGAGEVELCAKLDNDTERYLKDFYGDKVHFNQSYFEING